MGVAAVSTSSSIVVNSPSSQFVGMSGMVRWNGALQCLEIMDTSNAASYQSWTRLDLSNQGISIGLSVDAENIMNWARIKMIEEARLSELMAQHPGLKDAKEKFDIMLALTRKHTEGNDGG